MIRYTYAEPAPLDWIKTCHYFCLPTHFTNPRATEFLIDCVTADCPNSRYCDNMFFYIRELPPLREMTAEEIAVAILAGRMRVLNG